MSDDGGVESRITLQDLLLQVARENIEIQREDGSFPPGRNYTYDEHETPVRTTSHWLRTLISVYESNGDSVFAERADWAVNYLLSDDARPHGYTYHCRNVDSKDKCNGLVGQASAIRALAEAAPVLNRSDARDTAIGVFELHPFHEDLCLWERVEIDGQKTSFDRTLNHQLLFAGAAARLANDATIVRKRVGKFLDALARNMQIYENGLIAHYVRPPLTEALRAVAQEPRHHSMLRNEVASRYFARSTERRKKERSYQTVNLKAMAEIHAAFPSHPFWETEIFCDALEFVYDYEHELIERVCLKHGNLLQGIGIAKIRAEFESPDKATLGELVAADIADDPRAARSPFGDLGVDEETATALVSELVDLPNLAIPVNP